MNSQWSDMSAIGLLGRAWVSPKLVCSIVIFHNISVVCRSVNQGDTFLTQNIVHADCTWNIKMITWSKTVFKLYGTRLESRVLFLSFYLQCFRLQVVLNIDTHRNPRRALKSAQEQEDRWRRRNERDRARHAAETVEQRSERLRKQRERDCARRAAQTPSERQAASQQRSTRERERMAVETSEEKQTTNSYFSCPLAHKNIFLAKLNTR